VLKNVIAIAHELDELGNQSTTEFKLKLEDATVACKVTPLKEDQWGISFESHVHTLI